MKIHEKVFSIPSFTIGVHFQSSFFLYLTGDLCSFWTLGVKVGLKVLCPFSLVFSQLKQTEDVYSDYFDLLYYFSR